MSLYKAAQQLVTTEGLQAAAFNHLATLRLDLEKIDRDISAVRGKLKELKSTILTPIQVQLLNEMDSILDSIQDAKCVVSSSDTG